MLVFNDLCQGEAVLQIIQIAKDFRMVKNEMFYNHNWLGVTIKWFIAIYDEHLTWYNENKIRTSLGTMSPVEYLRSLESAAKILELIPHQY